MPCCVKMTLNCLSIKLLERGYCPLRHASVTNNNEMFEI